MTGHPPRAATHGTPVVSAAGAERKEERESRLAEALRANLRRRKIDLSSRSADSKFADDAAPAAIAPDESAG